jgi:hypothetical protein
LPARPSISIFELENQTKMNNFGTLTFIITVLFLVVSLAFLIVSLVRGQTTRARMLGVFIITWLAIYTGLLLAVSLASRSPTLETGQEHCFDEMCFSVQEVTQSDSLESGHAKGVFYIIHLRLHNAARRAAQKPSNPQIWVADAQGHDYPQMISAEQGHAGQQVSAAELWVGRLNPGETADRLVAFDLPANISLPVLMISEGSGFPTNVIIGDENSYLHSRTTFRLAVTEVH